MSDHATNLAHIAVLDILQSFGVSGIKSRQIAAKIEAAGYAIVPAADLERRRSRVSPKSVECDRCGEVVTLPDDGTKVYCKCPGTTWHLQKGRK